MKTNTRRFLVGTLLTFCLGALGACGGDSSTGGACGRSGNGVTDCTGSVGGSCSAGQYCNTAMLTCTPGCTSDNNCSSGESCVRASGEAVGACQRCVTAATATCGNGSCETGETSASCPADCHTAAAPVCGNHVCELGESSLCPADCATTSGPVCGNAVCETGESATTCPVDCTTTTNPLCPSVAGTYAVSAAPGEDAECAPPNATVAVTQTGCSVSVANLYPTPVTFTLDPTGFGTASYNMGGVSGAVTFTFLPTGMTTATDTGVASGCTINGARVP